MAKMNYVEPKGYFNSEMKKILKAGEKKAEKPASKTTAKKSTKK